MPRRPKRYRFRWQILHHVDGLDRQSREDDLLNINRFLALTPEERKAELRLANLSRHEADKLLTWMVGNAPIEEMNRTLTPAILEGFKSELTSAEARLWPQVALIIGINGGVADLSALSTEYCALYLVLIDKFDEFLIHVASSLGWRIQLLTIVQSRMTAWEIRDKDGPERFLRLGRAVRQAARVMQGQASAPVNDLGWPEFRKLTIRELKLLFAPLGFVLSTRNRAFTTAELLDWISDQLERSPEGFGRLHRNHVFLNKFLSEAEDIRLLRLLRSGQRISIAQFFDNWIAWGRGRSPDKLRAEISMINAIKRTRQ